MTASKIHCAFDALYFRLSALALEQPRIIGKHFLQGEALSSPTKTGSGGKTLCNDDYRRLSTRKSINGSLALKPCYL